MLSIRHAMEMLLATAGTDADGKPDTTYRVRTKEIDAEGKVTGKFSRTWAKLPADMSVASRVRAATSGVVMSGRDGAEEIPDTIRRGVVAANIVGRLEGMSADDVRDILADDDDAARRKAVADALRSELSE